MARQSRNRPVFGGRPRANLLPIRQRAELAHERTLPKLLVAIIIAGILAGLLWAAGLWAVHRSDARLSAAQSETEELHRAFAEHSELHHTRQEVEEISRQIGELDTGQAEYMALFDAVRDTLPKESTIEVFQARATSTEAPSGALCAAGAFSVTVTAQTPDVAAANAFVRDLSGLEANVCAEATALAADPSDERVTSTVQLVFDDSIAGPRTERTEEEGS